MNLRMNLKHLQETESCFARRNEIPILANASDSRIPSNTRSCASARKRARLRPDGASEQSGPGTLRRGREPVPERHTISSNLRRYVSTFQRSKCTAREKNTLFNTFFTWPNLIYNQSRKTCLVSMTLSLSDQWAEGRDVALTCGAKTGRESKCPPYVPFPKVSVRIFMQLRSRRHAREGNLALCVMECGATAHGCVSF